MSGNTDGHRLELDRRSFLGVAGAGLAGLALPGTGSADGGSGDPPVSGGDGGRAVAEVTLVTGDRVHVAEVGDDGEWAVAVDPAERDGPQPSFETETHGDDVYVVPSDAASLVPETLDRELFNVRKLVALAPYTPAGTTPTIVSEDDTRVGALDGTAGVASTTAFSSIDATAVTLDAEPFWRAATADAGPAGVADARAFAGVDRVWLNEPVTVELDDSVDQVGAPTAWDAGYDGEGVTIAVLDTGIDDSHPDVADSVVAAANFSDDDTADDGYGHGTHVAAIAAGSGAASDGARAGVAPGASLLNGKVLDSSGGGTLDAIIQGMEWAAEAGADVANMSLGAGATDGTDPLSQAVDALTAEYGTLFVVSAGNSGPSEESVTSPAPADAALAVGAVDKDDELAGFSSRGPRVGDYAVKPDVTAPGVDIVAARADGTEMGTPVGDDYTAASGTSMAAPHVAGAAAIVRQRYPDVDAAALKSALASTASVDDALTVYEQGGGRVDVPAALGTDVIATPAPLDLGYQEYPHDDADPVTESLELVNHGDEPVALDLSVDLAHETGDPPDDGAVTVDPGSVTVEAGASETVAVTLDPSLGAAGLYGGYLTASADGETVLAVPTGFYKEPELVDLAITGIARDGRDADRGSSVDVMNVDDRDAFFESSNYFADGEVTLRVPPGTYSVMGVLTTLDESGAFFEERVMVGEPELEVTNDTELVLDARGASEVVVDPMHEDAERTDGAVAYYREPAQGLGFTHSWSGDTPVWAAPTDSATTGAFEFYTEHTLVAPESSAYYDLVLPEPDAIPADLHYDLGEDDVATVPTAYHTDVPDHEINVSHAKWRPYQTITVTFTDREDGPLERTEYVSAGDTTWQKTVYAQPPFDGDVQEPLTSYDGGERREKTWHEQVARPGLIEGTDTYPASLPVRDGDDLDLTVAEWADAQTGADRHWGFREAGLDETAFRLLEDGDLVAEADRPNGTFPVSESSRIRLETDVARDADWWRTSVETRTAWEFDSSTTDGATPLPLLLVDYDVDVDLTNRAPHPRDGTGPFAVGLHVRTPRGVDDPDVDDVRVWTSRDDGDSWRERAVQARGDGRYRVVVDRRDPADAPTDYVSLRVDARDVAGNRIEQEVVRAYGLTPRE